MDKIEKIILNFGEVHKTIDGLSEKARKNLKIDELEDIGSFQTSIKEGAVKILGLSEEEADKLIEEEAPEDLLRRWLLDLDDEEINYYEP